MRAFRHAFAQACSVHASGGGSYTAQAVHFDTNTVVLGNMTGTDGPLLGMSLWFRYDQAGTSDVPASFFQSDNGPTICVDLNKVYVALSNADASAYVAWLSTETSATINVWHHLVVGTDCSDADPANWKRVAYLDDQLLTMPIQMVDLGAGPAPYIQGPGPLNNGMFNCNMQIVDWHLIINSQDVADFFIFTDQSLLTGSDITLAHRRLFIDGSGKPVDPATAVAALGSPTMLFSGNATGFVTNQGSGGGAFAVSEGALTNAASHP